MNMNRFVFAFAGSVIMISLVLGYFVSPYWLLLTGFVGLNMFQVAFTGFCPMATILKKFDVKAGGQKMSNIEIINCETLKKWIDNDDAIVIDVREAHEYDAAHIKGAILIPVGTCTAQSIPHNPDKKIVFHCKAGIRGGNACQICAEAMPEKTVYNLEGGLDAWVAKGLPIETT